MASVISMLCESSSDEELEMELSNPVKFPLELLLDDSEDDDDTVKIVQTILNSTQTAPKTNNKNYLEKFHYCPDLDFIRHFRLSRAKAYELMSLFRTSATYTLLKGHSGPEPLTSEQHILVFLWFAGHGSASYRNVADRFGITLSTLYAVITRVTEFLLAMAPNVIKFPTSEEKRETSRYFQEKANFPRVVGVLDSCLIKVDKPSEDPDVHFCRRKFYAVHVQGLVDHNRKFLDVVVGYPGSVEDAKVLQESELFEELPRFCADKHYIVGDSAYPLLKELIVPYKAHGNPPHKQKAFNDSLSSAHAVVKQAFRDLKHRFRQLHHCKLRSMQRIVTLIHACCVLHNMADASDFDIFSEELPQADDDDSIPIECGSAINKALRDILCNEVFNTKRD